MEGPYLIMSFVSELENPAGAKNEHFQPAEKEEILFEQLLALEIIKQGSDAVQRCL